MATPVKGKFCKVMRGTVVDPGVNWTLEIDPKLDDVSNFRDGRLRADTLHDAKVSLQLVYDSDAPPESAYKAGDTATVKLFVDNVGTKFYQLPVMMGTVKLATNDQEKTLRYDVEAHLHNGTITYPV